MTIPIYITSPVPGVAQHERTEWTDICRKPPFVTVGHDTLRPASRWTFIERKKKFSVTVYSKGRVGLHVSDVSWYPTLEKALIGATNKSIWWGEAFARWEATRKSKAQQATPS
jgi:hypothetical protein